MSDRIDIHRLQDLGGGVAIARSNAVKDVTLLTVATDYRRDISRAYIQLTEKEILERFPADQKLAVSRKYDGEAVFIYFDETEAQVFAFNAPSGRLRVGLKPLLEIGEKLKAAGVQRALCVGELYLKRGDGPRPTHSDILRASFRNQADEQAQIAVALYDIIMLDGRDWRHAEDGFTAVWAKLGELFGEDESAAAHRVKGSLVTGGQAVADAFQREVSAGEEGIVVRRLGRVEIFKIKPLLTVDAVVVGYVEDQVENTYGIASLLVGLTTGDYIREFVRVGSGFTDDDRVRLLKELSVDKVDAPLTKTDSDGRPIQFVTPRLIVEIKGENLETERLSGQENVTPSYQFDQGAYSFLGTHPLARLTHATFSGFREDKDLASGGARLTQVVDVETEKSFSAEKAAGEAKVVTRRVFTKGGKGGVALRKFVLIETDGVGRFPYVVLFTDASLGRKDPFQRTIKVAHTREAAETLFNELIEENVKKGWLEDGVEAPPEPPKPPAKKAAKKSAQAKTDEAE